MLRVRSNSKCVLIINMEVENGKVGRLLYYSLSYDDEHTHIEKVKVRPDNADKLGKESIWQRGEVVSSIEDDNTFITVIKEDKEWKKGEDVHIIEVNDEKYMRTDNNETEEDNLGKLPEF